MIAAPTLNPGKLDRRATLLARLTSRNVMGEAVESWAAVDTVWAGWLQRNSREFLAALARHSETTGVLRLRYRADIDATWRLLIDGRTHELIGDPIELGRREYLDLSLRVLNPGMLTVDAPSVKAFTLELAADIDAMSVEYPTPFVSAPRGLWCSILIPSGGYSITVNADEGSRTASGFTARFGATIPESGYKLSVIAIQ